PVRLIVRYHAVGAGHASEVSTVSVRSWTPLLFGILLLVACAPTPAAREPSGGAVAPSAEPARTLVASVRVEPSSVALRPFREAGVALFLSRRMFNAELAIRDERAVPRPYLAESLPELNTDAWRVFPDGRMES